VKRRDTEANHTGQREQRAKPGHESRDEDARRRGRVQHERADGALALPRRILVPEEEEQRPRAAQPAERGQLGTAGEQRCLRRGDEEEQPARARRLPGARLGDRQRQRRDQSDGERRHEVPRRQHEPGPAGQALEPAHRASLAAGAEPRGRDEE